MSGIAGVGRVVRVDHLVSDGVERVYLHPCGHTFELSRGWPARATIGQLWVCPICRPGRVPRPHAEVPITLPPGFISGHLEGMVEPVENAQTLRDFWRAAISHYQRRREATDTPLTIRFRTKDHPDVPGNGDVADRRVFVYAFPLEDGRRLELAMGAKGRLIFESLFLAEMVENSRGAFDPTEDR